MKVEAAKLAGLKLSIGPHRINQKFAVNGHLSRDRHVAGSADDWMRLRGLSFARSPRPTAALLDLCGNARTRLGSRYRDGFPDPGFARKHSAARCGRVHPFAHG